ncbi:MAG: nitroreductase [Oscillospiraceae bacterium]|nr:nitroreductase [Oscillospiraceae bacterium]MBQ7000282.1 nitroreductase [Oscillospiraceae bacterium]
MNEAILTMLQRRSTKSYRDTPVPEELLDKVLEAGLYAPTGRNNQDVICVAVTNKAIRDQLSKMNAAVLGVDSDPFYGAPCVIVVLAESTGTTWVEDGSLVLGNMMNAAQALNLGSCWIHRARQMFDSPEGKQLLKDWGLPETMRGVGNCILGYPAAEPTQKPRKEGRILKVK